MDFFLKKAVGLDIADHTIVAVELRKRLFSSLPTITAQNKIALEHGIVDHGRISNRKKLVEALETLWSDFGRTPQSVYFGLPEHQVYSSVIHLPHTERLDTMIAQAAVKTLPIEKEDLAFSYSLISSSHDGADVLVYGASREAMNDWRDFFASINIDIRAFDHELLAIERGLFGTAIHETSCIVDVGAERTKIALFSQRGLEYVHAIDIAGDTFTLELSRAMELSKDQAEKMKREQGMQPINLNAIFTKLLDSIVAEIQASVEFAKSGIEERVSRIVLVGGSAQLKGLPEYLGEQLKIPVKLGCSFLLPKTPPIDLEQLNYIEAIGLALKGIDSVWEKRHPSLR